MQRGGSASRATAREERSTHPRSTLHPSPFTLHASRQSPLLRVPVAGCQLSVDSPRFPRHASTHPARRRPQATHLRFHERRPNVPHGLKPILRLPSRRGSEIRATSEACPERSRGERRSNSPCILSSIRASRRAGRRRLWSRGWPGRSRTPIEASRAPSGPLCGPTSPGTCRWSLCRGGP